ncbi:hypothetical protein QTP70_020721 [Hemibagrus guttatus]|uniref:FAM192A/Fyv6 N-terminal domain-containing protein n=1 Tax=Hemibagrus guttatus TaxID=175788 RepID=A0AAE0RBN4_9TELE|nr:hypothetical protein QTP70_020721 [Hemibagrus guttatus]
MADGVDLSRKFVTESELEEKRKRRQEEWEKVRKPDDPEEVPEEEYDPRSLFEKLQEQKDKKQEEYEEQFKFRDQTMLISLNRKHGKRLGCRRGPLSGRSVTEAVPCREAEERRGETGASGIQDILSLCCTRTPSRNFRSTARVLSLLASYFVKLMRSLTLKSHSALKKLVSSESQKKEPEKKATPKPPEQKTSHLSQAHLLAGAVKRRSSSQSSESSKKQKVEETTTAAAAETTGNGSQTEQETVGQKPVSSAGVTRGGMLQRPSAAMCVGILPGLGAYSGSSDSESSSDSEGSVEGTTFSIKCHRLFR